MWIITAPGWKPTVANSAARAVRMAAESGMRNARIKRS